MIPTILSVAALWECRRLIQVCVELRRGWWLGL
jgi:hypothetical protein